MREIGLRQPIAGGVITLVNGFLTFVPPLAGWGRPPAFPEYLFFATIETVATSVIIWQAWTWSGVEAEVSTERERPPTGSWDHFFLATELLKNVARRSMPLEATVPTANCRV